MDIFDLLIAPFYATVILLIAYKFSRKRMHKQPVYKYFFSGLAVKMVGAVALGLVYFYYYKGGDTINYYNTAVTLADVFLERRGDFWHLYFGEPFVSEFYLMNPKNEFIYWVNDPYAFFVSKCFVPVVLICLKSYAASAIVVASVCFLGVWRLFLIFVREFPKAERHFTWSILYIPSVIFWGSGIMKDSVTFSATCFYVHGFYWFFTQKRRSITYLASLIGGATLLILIKPYILFALLPGSILWFTTMRVARIQNAFLKIMFMPTLIFIGITLGLFALQQMGDLLGKYSMEKVIGTASGAQQDLKQSYYRGNSFDIGNYEPTISGLLSVSHKAVYAALFRPTFFDVRNVVMGLCAIENSFILGFCIYLLVKLRVYKFFGMITAHPLLMFSFVFSLFFAFSVGVSISNYGALVRLKIPCIPFFLSSLVIMNYMMNENVRARKARRKLKVDEKGAVWIN